MRIPTHLQQIANNLGLKSWVEGKKFPWTHYAQSIETYRQRLENLPSLDSTGDLNINQALAVMVGEELNVEGALSTHVLDENSYDIGDDAEWKKICEAAGWCVMQRYEREATEDS